MYAASKRLERKVLYLVVDLADRLQLLDHRVARLVALTRHQLALRMRNRG